MLPEEVNRGRVAVRPERRREVLRLLADSIHLALDKLERLITEANDGDTKAKAFRAFAEWVYLDTLYYDQRGITLDPNSLGNGVLVNTALEGLYSPVTFDAAVDAVSELIRFTQHGPDAKEGKIPEAMMPLAQRLVGEVMKLQPHFRAAVQVRGIKAIQWNNIWVPSIFAFHLNQWVPIGLPYRLSQTGEKTKQWMKRRRRDWRAYLRRSARPISASLPLERRKHKPPLRRFWMSQRTQTVT